MKINKALLSLFALDFILLSGCTLNNKENNNFKEETKSNIVSENFNEEKIIFSPPSFNSEYLENARKSNEYLYELIKNKSNMQNIEYLTKSIEFSLQNLEHTPVVKDTNNTIFYNVSELNLGQLQRIYLMINSLKESSFVQEIGKEIKRDVENKFAEHGGLTLFNKKRIYLKSIESCLIKDTIYNGFYGPSEESFSIPNLGSFHIHAEEYNEKDYAHPSSRDLIISYFSTHLANETHDFVITSLEKGKFNVDYYGGHKTDNPITKVLDLGNYTYDTLDLK
jgi:hypothetical protein